MLLWNYMAKNDTSIKIKTPLVKGGAGYEQATKEKNPRARW